MYLFTRTYVSRFEINTCDFKYIESTRDFVRKKPIVKFLYFGKNQSSYMFYFWNTVPIMETVEIQTTWIVS